MLRIFFGSAMFLWGCLLLFLAGPTDSPIQVQTVELETFASFFIVLWAVDEQMRGK